jgi:hypothetical protein
MTLRVCLQCGEQFSPKDGRQRFNSDKCREAYRSKRRGWGGSVQRCAALIRRALPPEMANAVGAAPERLCGCGGQALPNLSRCLLCETDRRVGKALRAEAKKKAAPQQRQARLDAHTALTPTLTLAVEE